MKGKRKLKLRVWTTPQLKKRLQYLKSKWPKKVTNEMKYINYHLKKRGEA